MKIQSLLFLGVTSIALVNAQVDNGVYAFAEERGAAQSSEAVEPTFELLRTSYVAPTTPTASTPAPTAAGAPMILTPATTVVPAATPASTKSDCASACNAMFKPVCGSDGKTYSNSCMMSIAQCEKPDAKITMQSEGTCVEGSTTPAATTPSGSGITLPTTTPVGEITPAPTQPTEQPAPDTPAPSESKCTQMCSSDFTPLCGSDGKTYSNACALSVAQCQSPSDNIAKVADGECSSGSSETTTPAPVTPAPVTPVTAPETPAPVPASEVPTPATPAKCEKMCTADFKPVCGSNGKTYSNACALSVAQCGSPSVSITKASDGECGSGVSVTTAPAVTEAPTTPVSEAPVTPAAGGTSATPAPVSVPSATKPNQGSTSKCELACSKMYAPVCGSNNKTYNNACLLRLFNCKSGIKRTITIKSQGACSKGSSGSGTTKPSGSTGGTQAPATTSTSASGGTTSTASTTSTTSTTSTGSGVSPSSPSSSTDTSTSTTGTSTTTGGKTNYLRGNSNSNSNSPYQGQ